MEEHTDRRSAAAGRIDAHQLDVIVRRCGSLPTRPDVAAAILELTGPGAPGDEGERLRLVARLVAADPALAAKVLSMAADSSPSPAGTVAQAVRHLPADAVRSAALSAAAAASSPRPRCGWDHPAFCTHCLAVASAAGLLAEGAAADLDREQAFTCGLLHDLGKLLLADALPRSYARALAGARSHHASLAAFEGKVLGVDHLAAGRRLARLWRLPRAVENVIWLHHQPAGAIPPSAGDRTLVLVVALADALARRGALGFSGNCSAPPPTEGLARALGIGGDLLDEVAGRLPEAVERHGRLLGLSRVGRKATCLALSAAASEELGRLHESLRRRADALSARARAFDRLARFAASLPPDATVGDVLARIAEALLAPAGAAGRCAVAYGLDDRGGSILAVRRGPKRPPEWRSFALRAPGGEGPAPRPPAAAEALPDLLAEADGWRAWAGEAAGAHLPLTCGGRWLGGVLLPADAAAETPDALAGALGMALGLVRQRRRAVELSEELARASRELADAQEAMADARTLEAIGDLAAGAAHELNTPLAVVSGRAQLMRDRADSDEDRKTWQTIVEQAQRISDTITELMQVARPPQPHRSAVAAGELLARAAETFSSSDHPQAKSAQVDIQTEDGCPNVWADPAQMQAVLVELMTNAATAAPAGPHIHLAAEPDGIDPGVLLTVRDDGPGMDERTAARACTPFFSAQPAGRRRGLGLPRARRLVESNGGKIWIDSRLGRGTTVRILLPAEPDAGDERKRDDGQP